jgi:hypothetical protein
MKQLSTSGTVLVVMTLWAGLGYGAPDRANVGQADFQEDWVCEGPTDNNPPNFSEFVEVSGSPLALTTAGQPVMVSLAVNMQGTNMPGLDAFLAGFQTRPVVNRGKCAWIFIG